MPSSIETRARRLADFMVIWNRRLHYYIGLYLLLFLWLFAFTGLLLNHPQWTFAEFWPTRTQSASTQPIQMPAQGGDLIQAQDIMRQLGVRGEIEWTKTRSDLKRLEFRVSRPGHIFEVNADLEHAQAAVQRIDLNAWGVARLLHTFTGVSLSSAVNDRDWTLTKIWAFCLDALAAGLILMILSSLYMWWSLKRKRRWGMCALGLGAGCCAFFVIGLRWLF
jgi:hypothetical protein